MGNFSVATWNVNSLRKRQNHVERFLRESHVDVLCLQETKVTDEAFPAALFNDLGYAVVCHGEKSYNGVAIAVKGSSPGRVETGFGDAELDSQARCISTWVADLRVVSVYVPNGTEVGHEKFLFKLKWLAALRNKMVAWAAEGPTVVVGDFNVAPDDRDVYAPSMFEEKNLCSTVERDALFALLDAGYYDATRLFDQRSGQYTWWDYRQRGFEQDHGLRIDLVLASFGLAARCEGCEVMREPRTWEEPSDHTPVVASFNVAFAG